MVWTFKNKRIEFWSCSNYLKILNMIDDSLTTCSLRALLMEFDHNVHVGVIIWKNDLLQIMMSI